MGLAPGDGFKVKLDGPRLEVNTRPFETTTAPRRIEDAAVRIKTFTDALASGCDAAGPTTGSASPALGAGRQAPTRSPPELLGVGGAAGDDHRQVVASVGAGGPDPEHRTGRCVAHADRSRIGLRSEGVYRAQREVKKARRAASFSDDLEGFLILSYLWTGELPYRYPGDRRTG